MDVLVNATTLIIGGGIQVAASFISESINDNRGIRWHYAISRQVRDELQSLGVVIPDAHVFEISPSRSKVSRRRLSALEKELAPDVVFSVFGPAYVDFQAPHLCGVAVGWVTHASWLAFAALPGWVARIKMLLICAYQGYWLRYADRWVVEAGNAKAGLQRRMRVPLADIDIVPNTCAAVFMQTGMEAAQQPENTDTVRLLYVSAYYPHKNFEFIPDVAVALTRLMPDRDFEFVVTLPEDEPGLQRLMNRARSLGVEHMIRNAGRVSLHEVIKLYESSHICFMPSLLETFSATYPEAMALGRPVVTSDLDFAHAICGDAAAYFTIGDANSAAKSIINLLQSSEKWKGCIRRGREVLAGLPDAKRKYELYVQTIRATAVKNIG